MRAWAWVLWAPVLVMILGRAYGASDPLGPEQSLAAVKVAVTVDDIPANGDLMPGITRMDTLRGVIRALKHNRVPQAYGFANRFAGLEDVAKEWLAAGYPLGNHTYDHVDLGRVGAREYIADIEKMDQAFLTLGPFTPPVDQRRMFRYPYLQEGETLEKRDAVRDHLLKNRYRIAEVTIDYEDWAWNAAYLRCVKQGDDQGIGWLREHVADAAERHVRRANALARALFNREIAQIMLLHGSAFNALVLDTVLEGLRANGVEFITLDEALADPAYRINPDLGLATGLTFLEQIAAKRHVNIDRWQETRYPRGAIDRICTAPAAAK
jgi:peptidoglycan-N-acetylglucosamine deacetylase